MSGESREVQQTTDAASYTVYGIHANVHN